MKKEQETTNSNMDFSSASAIIGGLDSFLEEGVSFNTSPSKEKEQEHKEEVTDISSLVSLENETETEVETDVEEEVEKTTEEVDKVKPEPKVTEKPKVTEGTDYKSLIKSLVDKKIFEGFDTIETEDGEIPFEDFDVDSETFVEIVKSKIEEVKEQASSNTTKGLSDFTKHLLEIEKNGGNVSQALETYQNFQDPLDSFDLTDEIDQQKVIFMKYHNVMGMEKDVVIDLIDGFMSKGKLEDEAFKAETEIRGAINKQLEEINQQAVSEKEKKKEGLKLYRKNLGEKLNEFQLNENYKRKILDIATKEDETGAFQLDSLYYNQRNDPEKAAALLLFLTDQEEYKRQITNEEVRNTKLDTFKKLKLVNKGSDNIKITSKDKTPVTNKNVIAIEEIFGS